MNLLIDNAPDRVNGIPVYTDYRNMVQFELLMRDPDIDNLQKVQLAIDLLYKEPVPSFESAWDGLLWFYRGGVDEQRSSAASGAEKRVYDYEQDAGLIVIYNDCYRSFFTFASEHAEIYIGYHHFIAAAEFYGMAHAKALEGIALIALT